MQAIFNGESTLIVAMIVAYIAFTAWLTVRLRSKTSDQFMTGARAMPEAASSSRRDCFGYLARSAAVASP